VNGWGGGFEIVFPGPSGFAKLDNVLTIFSTFENGKLLLRSKRQLSYYVGENLVIVPIDGRATSEAAVVRDLFRPSDGASINVNRQLHAVVHVAYSITDGTVIVMQKYNHEGIGGTHFIVDDTNICVVLHEDVTMEVIDPVEQMVAKGI